MLLYFEDEASFSEFLGQRWPTNVVRSPSAPMRQMGQLKANVSSPAILQLQLKGESPPHQDQTGNKAGDWGAKQVGATIKVRDTCARVQEERQLRQRAQDGFSECEDKVAAWLAMTAKFSPLPSPSPATILEDLAMRPRRTQAKYQLLEAREAAEDKARECARFLPEPLTTALLSAAYKEVPSGAEKTIEHVIDCWRTSKLSAHDVIAIVKSFSGSSSVLRSLFAEQAQEGEVASEEQMAELARQAAA
jgi:hypothetical protein